MNGQKKDPKDILKEPYFKRWLPVWHLNAMENYPVIKRDFGVIKEENGGLRVTKNLCVSSSPRPVNRPAIIMGSGPSLDEVAPFLKNWTHPIFASASNAFVAARHEREPEFICAFDSHWVLFEQLKIKDYRWSKDKAVLLTHPYAEPKMIKQWKGSKLYYRRYYVGMEFSEVILPFMFPWIRIGFRVTGSVVNNAISIAHFWGYNPIFLVGVDLGWKDDSRARAMLFKPRGRDEWDELPPPTAEDLRKRRGKEIISFPDGNKTTQNLISFKDSLLQIWKGDKVKLINCTKGFLSELPYADPFEVIKKSGIGFEELLKTDEEINETVQKYFISKQEQAQKEKREKEKREKIGSKSSFTPKNQPIEDLAKKYNTDKDGRHNYIPIYKKYFEPIKKEVKKVLEIGIYQGASHKMWHDYFEEAIIYGLDLHEFNLATDRFISFIADQGNKEHLKLFINKCGSDFDIIIDDGSHRWMDQQVSLGFLFRFVKPGGIYIIEDLHTSHDEKKNIPIKTKYNTLMILNQLSKGQKIISDFISEEDSNYIMENTEFCVIEKGKISEIAFIKHK